MSVTPNTRDQPPSSDISSSSTASRPSPQSTFSPHRLTLLSNVQWEQLVSGTAGGVAATVALHPLDLIKVRFQVNEGTGVAVRPEYFGIRDALTKIYRHGGGFRALYQGLVPNMWGSGSAWGIYFLLYEAMKAHRQQHEAHAKGSGQLTSLSPLQHMGYSALGGAATLMVTNPIFVAKTRLFLQYEQELNRKLSSTSAGPRPAAAGRGPPTIHYRGMLHTLYCVARFEGVPGLYKGLIPGLFGVSHGAVQFVTYEELKKRYCDYMGIPHKSKLSVSAYLTFAGLSKLMAAAVTYPYQVVRSRLQDQHRVYNGVVDVTMQTWRNEGVYGFYKGLGPTLIRVVPASCITFVVYESLSGWMLGHR